jgi:hypothetical protein
MSSTDVTDIREVILLGPKMNPVSKTKNIYDEDPIGKHTQHIENIKLKLLKKLHPKSH